MADTEEPARALPPPWFALEGHVSATGAGHGCAGWMLERAEDRAVNRIGLEQVLPIWLEQDCQRMGWAVRIHGSAWLAQSSVQPCQGLTRMADSRAVSEVHVRQSGRRTV